MEETKLIVDEYCTKEVKMANEVEIEVLGHKAKIYSVSARQADGVWYKEDFLMVSIDFGDSIEGLAGFAVDIPVKRYTNDEFLAIVQAEAEKVLPKLLQKHREERETRQRQHEKQEALDLVVGELRATIGLEK